MRERHVHETSVLNTEKRRLAETRGEFFNDGKPWVNEHLNILMNGLLVYNWGYTAPAGRKSFQSELGRSPKSIETYGKWKVPARYPDVAWYESQSRVDRSGAPWSKRDYSFLEIATGEKGIEHGGCMASWIRRVLARDENEVREWLRQRAERMNRGMGLFSKPNLDDEVVVAKIVHPSFAGCFSACYGWMVQKQ